MKKTAIASFFTLVAHIAQSQTTHHGIDPNWYQTPKATAAITGPISPTNNISGSVANAMVVKSNGTVIIFYRQGGQNKWIQSSDGGNTWTSPGTLYPPAAFGLNTISADIDQSDNIHIIWKSGNFSLGYAKYNGSSWVTTNTINTQTQNAGDTVQFSQITVDRKGRIHIMWQQGNHQNYSGNFYSTCWYARSIDGGSTFTSSQLSQNTINYHHAAFPVADFGGTSHDTLMIAWRENVNGCSSPTLSMCSPNGWNWDVKARITYDGGATWNPVITIQGSGLNNADDDQWDPNIVVDKNGVIHAFYHVYHNMTVPDYNANIMYEYSLDGGNIWSTPTQLSTNNIRSHLIKTAYDYTNNYVWCTWKDEMDFGNLPSGNPQADLKAVYIQNTGTPVISPQEFITDQDSFEVALHNFKVGNDGIMRATYNIAKLQGKGDTIFYTQRSALITGIANNKIANKIKIYPNPTTDIINVVLNEPGIKENFEIKLFNMQGQLIEERKNNLNPIQLPTSGVYILEIKIGTEKHHEKIIKE
ncbi:MAG: hypothetical protein Fur0023_21550 [Bacteroidia bacterium]